MLVDLLKFIITCCLWSFQIMFRNVLRWIFNEQSEWLFRQKLRCVEKECEFMKSYTETTKLIIPNAYSIITFFFVCVWHGMIFCTINDVCRFRFFASTTLRTHLFRCNMYLFLINKKNIEIAFCCKKMLYKNRPVIILEFQVI